MTLTIKEAYLAMFYYLDDYYSKMPSDDLGNLLSDMALLPDGDPANPAAWEDWKKAVEKIKRN